MDDGSPQGCRPWFCAQEMYGVDSCWGQGPVLFCVGGVKVERSSILLSTYAVVVLMVLLFFCWEDGPIHRSPSFETTYLIVCLTIAQCSTLLCGLGDASGLSGKDLPCDKDNNFQMHTEQMHTINSLRKIVGNILFIQLVQYHVQHQQHVAFDETTRKDQSRRRLGYKAMRLSEDIQSLVDKITYLTRPSNVAKVMHKKGVVIFLIFVILCIMDLCWVIPQFAMAIRQASFVIERFLDLVAVGYVPVRILQRNAGRLREELDGMIAAVLSMAEPDTIEDVLSTVNVPLLIEVANWNTVVRLTERGVEMERLTTVSKGILLDALQKNGVRKRKVVEEVKRLFFSCQGQDLTDLKTAIDRGGDYYNLYKLMYGDIKDKHARRLIFDHFEAQAKDVRKQRGTAAGLKILSDIDDTLYASGGFFPAGVDARFPRHAVYPGVLALFCELDAQKNQVQPKSTFDCNLIFLSARPHVYKDFAEEKSYKLFRHLVVEQRLHTMPTLLSGNLFAGIKTILTYCCMGVKAWKSVGNEKVAVYKKFQHLYREYDFIFFGDNGQGDLWAGEHMVEFHENNRSKMEAQAWPPLSSSQSAALCVEPRLLHVVIHKVLPDHQHLRHVNFQAALRPYVSFHRSYVGAALLLHRVDPTLVRVEALVRIVDEAVKDFDRMRLAYSDFRNWEEAEHDLRTDIEEVRKVVGALSVKLANEIPMLERSEVFERATRLDFRRTLEQNQYMCEQRLGVRPLPSRGAQRARPVNERSIPDGPAWQQELANREPRSRSAVDQQPARSPRYMDL